MVMDISKFHRRTPIAPAHKRWFVMQGRPGKLYIQHCCPFGARASEGNSGQVSRVVIRIWSLEGMDPNGKWSDDIFIFVKPISGSGTEEDPWIYGYGEEQVLEAVRLTNTPFHPLESKGQKFAPSFDYVGMLWDLESRSVGLREEKRRKFLFRSEIFEVRARESTVTETQCMEIHGSLCHIAYVHRLGRSRLSALSTFTSKFDKYPHGTALHAPPSVITDMSWWSSQLRIENFSRTLLHLGNVRDLGISVDASTVWGVGLKFGDRWDAWRLRPGWKGPSRDIGWLECLAIELLVLHLETMGLRDCRIKLLSDNQGIIGAYNKGRSRNPEVNFSIRRFMHILDCLQISLEVSYVRSEDNPADPISRGELGPKDLQLLPSISLPE